MKSTTSACSRTQEKKSDALELLGRYAPEMAKMKSQLKMTDDHVTELENAVKALRTTSNRKGDVIYEQRQEIEKLKMQVMSLNQKQHQLQKTIDKIPPEVMERLKKDERARRKAEREAR